MLASIRFPAQNSRGRFASAKTERAPNRPALVILSLLLASLSACATPPARAAGETLSPAVPETTTPARTPAPTWTLPFATPLPAATRTPARTPVPTWTLPFATPLPSATRLRVPEALFTPTPTQPPCHETQGEVISLSVPSETLNYPIDTRLYLPPCYTSRSARYPTLYLIHGLGFTQNQWERLGAPAAADQLIAAGEIAPLIIVMPRDRKDPRLDPALVTDLAPYIDANYRTRPEREFRAIGGLSRGAGWALHIGLRYPELFGRLGAHSPVVFYGEENATLQWIRAIKPASAPALYFDIGDTDPTRQSAVWLDQVFTWFKLDHTYLLQSGTHNEAYWSAHVADYLRFYAADWRAAPTPPADAP